MDADRCIPIDRDGDVVTARQAGRSLAAQLGFSGSEATLIATAISEVARNILVHAGRGEIVLSSAQRGPHPLVTLFLKG